VKFNDVPVSLSELQWSPLVSLCLSVYYSAIPCSSCVQAGTYVCGQQGTPHRWGHTASCRYLKWHNQQARQITVLAYGWRVVGMLIP